MAGITKHGFKRKQYSEIETELFLSAKEQFGEDINVSEKSFLGILLRIVAWSISLIWQLAENIYHQMNYRHAEGINLDYIVERAAMKRFPKAKARGKLIITGEQGKEIYSGFRAKSADGREYRTLASAVIGENGTVEVEAESVLYGKEQNIEAEKITIVSYPEARIRSVSNKIFIGGREEETDQELRDRFEKTKGNKGKSNIDGIERSVLEVATVDSVIVEENNEDTMQNGIPPHAIRVIVSGGEDEEVAKAILESKAAGIATAGDTTCQVKDNRNRMRTVKFQRTTDIAIHISVKVSFNNDIAIEKEAVKRNIKEAVLSYIKYLRAGQDVITNKILAMVMDFEEVRDVEIKIGKHSSTLTTQNIPISDKEIAKTDAEKVSVSDEL